MKFSDDFNSFLRSEVNIDKARLDKVDDRVGAIRTFVAEHPTFADAFLDVIPAGSWAHRTIIKPVAKNDEFDADILLYLKEQTGWKARDYLEQLHGAFASSSTYKPLSKLRTRCVRIDYPGDFHVDVVPYLERHGSHFITNRLDPANEGSFELSDPERFTVWLEERAHATNGTFVKVVRLMKYLRDYKNTFTCKSIILTTLLGNQVNAIEASLKPQMYADVPSTLVTLLEALAAYVPATMPAVMDPAGTGDNFTDRYKDEWNYTNFREWIAYYAAKARSAYDETDRDKSVERWRSIFGDRFKPGSLTETKALAPFSAGVAWPGEQQIDRAPYAFPLKIVPAYRVRIEGRCTGLKTAGRVWRNGFRQFDLAQNGTRVPKHRSLRFTATINVPEPYTLYWKVRNGGEEAASLKALRGEITQDEGDNSKIESTLYRGTHYVDCYVVKDGAVVAKDHQTVIVTG